MSILLLLEKADTADLRQKAVERVGRLLRARTVDAEGNQVGVFTNDTRPTGTDVGDFVDDAAQDVFITAGQESAGLFTDVTEPAAWVLVAIRAAMLVELSYWPQQTESADSAYQQLRQLYDDGMRNLVTAVEDNAATGVRFASVPITTSLSADSALLASDLLV